MSSPRAHAVVLFVALAILAPVAASTGLVGGTSQADESVDFGGVDVGDSRTLEYTLENPYDESITAKSYSLTGPDADAFEIVKPEPPVTVPSADTRDVAIRFSPDHAGNHEATLTVELEGAVNRTVTIALNGTGEVPRVELASSSLEFGGHRIGSETVRTIQVSNTGKAPLELSSLDVTGADADAFDVVAPDEGTTIAPGESTQVRVAYVPGDEGDDAATLTIGTNDPERETVDVDLAGSGLRADIEVDPVRLRFGDVSVGETATREVTIENTGDASIEVTGFSLEGADARAFSVQGGGFTLDAGESATVTVTFAPEDDGPRRARLIVESDVSGEESIGVTLSGRGTAPDIRVDTKSLNFGNVTVGETVERTVTIRNVGSDPLTLRSTSIVGPTPEAFRVLGDPTPRTLSPGESVTVTVEFTPASGGTKQAYLQLRSDDPDSPLTNVWLSNTNTVVEVETTESDTETTVNVSVTNASAGDSVPVNVTSEKSQEQNASVDEVNVTVAEDADFSLNVTQRASPGEDTPAFQPPDGTQPVGYTSVEHSVSDDDIDQVTFTVRVKQSTLAERNASPENVALYRYHDGEWVELETTIVRENDDFVVYRAISPGLSDFTTGVKQPKFEISQASVEVTDVSQGESVGINVRITNTGGADGRFTAKLILNGEVVNEKTTVIALNGTGQITFDYEFTEPGEYEVRVNDEPVDTIIVQQADLEGTAADVNSDTGAFGGSLPMAALAAAGLVVLLLGGFGARRMFGGSGGEAVSDATDDELGAGAAASSAGGPLQHNRPEGRPPRDGEAPEGVEDGPDADEAEEPTDGDPDDSTGADDAEEASDSPPDDADGGTDEDPGAEAGEEIDEDDGTGEDTDQQAVEDTDQEAVEDTGQGTVEDTDEEAVEDADQGAAEDTDDDSEP